MRSVAGEAKQMTAVMDELVHIHAAEHRGRPLLDADEIEPDHEQQAAENRPGQDFAHRDGNRSGDGKGRGNGHSKLLESRVARSPLVTSQATFKRKPALAATANKALRFVYTIIAPINSGWIEAGGREPPGPALQPGRSGPPERPVITAQNGLSFGAGDIPWPA